MEKFLEKIVSAAYLRSTVKKIVSDHNKIVMHLICRKYKTVLNSNAVNKILILKFTASLNFCLIN